MPTYDEVLFLGVEIGILALLPIIAGFLAWLGFRRHRKDWVYADIQLRSGPAKRPCCKPQNGWIRTKKWGSYPVPPDGMSGIWKGKPLFRFAEGVPRPIRYDRDILRATITGPDGKPKEVFQEIVRADSIAPSSYRISNYIRDHTHAQVYGAGGKLELIAMITLILLVIVLLAVVVK